MGCEVKSRDFHVAAGAELEATILRFLGLLPLFEERLAHGVKRRVKPWMSRSQIASEEGLGDGKLRRGSPAP